MLRQHRRDVPKNSKLNFAVSSHRVNHVNIHFDLADPLAGIQIKIKFRKYIDTMVMRKQNMWMLHSNYKRQDFSLLIQNDV